MLIMKCYFFPLHYLFYIPKLWNDSHRPERVLPACKKTLADLQLDYLDLYLIHWPIAFVPDDAEDAPKDRNPTANIDSVPIQDTWRAMEDLVAKGLTKHIGVSNFNVALLNDLLAYAKIKPVVNQVELHPYNQQTRLVQWCAKKGIHCTGYSPLVRVGTVKDSPVNVLTDPIISKIAKKHNRSNAQVTLRWQLQREPNISTIPKSTKKERLVENIAIFDFELDDEDMKEIATLDRGLRMCEPSGFFGIPVFD